MPRTTTLVTYPCAHEACARVEALSLSRRSPLLHPPLSSFLSVCASQHACVDMPVVWIGHTEPWKGLWMAVDVWQVCSG